MGWWWVFGGCEHVKGDLIMGFVLLNGMEMGVGG